ncbi:MAG: hypothetical protein QNJ98_02965 [Planctomycetota bacterium]|nr:hypothetical protein [Planctomycetota bacterium]
MRTLGAPFPYPGWLAAMAFVVLCLGPAAPPALAGECIGCPEPSVSEIVAAENVTLASRSPEPPFDLWGGASRDYMEMDAGDCEFNVTGPEEADRVATWLVLRAYGEVWNCPHSKSSSTISASVTHEDRSDWSLAATVSAGLELGVLKAGAELTETNGGSRGIKETSDLSTTLTAQACRRIPWLAYLRVARYRIEMTVTMVQPYAWWTKNDNTGAKVHQKGTYEVECLSVDIPFQRKAPLAWHLHLASYPCEGCSSEPPKDEGWFPKLPPGVTPPPVPDDVPAWPEPEPEAPREPHEGGEAPDEDGDAPADGIVEPNGLPPEAEPWFFPPVG